MSKEVRYIELIFENCEFIKIDSKDITLLNIENIRHNISGTYGHFDDSYYSDDIEMILPKNANVNKTSNFDVTELLFDRIANNDITSINLVYSAKENKQIYVPYEEETANVLGSPNILQKTIIHPEGYLELHIKGKERT